MINFESPLWVDILLYTIYGLLTLSVGLTVWSMVRNARRQGIGEKKSNGIPTRLIIIATVILLAGSLLLTYLLASTQQLMINQKPFNDLFWLRISDMLINTSLILMAVAVVGVIIGYSGLSRRLKR